MSAYECACEERAPHVLCVNHSQTYTLKVSRLCDFVCVSLSLSLKEYHSCVCPSAVCYCTHTHSHTDTHSAMTEAHGTRCSCRSDGAAVHYKPSHPPAQTDKQRDRAGFFSLHNTRLLRCAAFSEWNALARHWYRRRACVQLSLENVYTEVSELKRMLFAMSSRFRSSMSGAPSALSVHGNCIKMNDARRYVAYVAREWNIQINLGKSCWILFINFLLLFENSLDLYHQYYYYYYISALSYSHLSIDCDNVFDMHASAAFRISCATYTTRP